ERIGLAIWGYFATRPKLYRLATRVAARMLRVWAGSGRKIRHLPFLRAWTDGRDMPAPQGQTFRDWYAKRKK
ncbi:MAG: DUF3390 domain-containing protein, partial [Burkholderiales bacterium]|nr:DUF3390 domain-containing protein [Burkholderiales bacterium]